VYINCDGGEGTCDYAIFEHLRLSGKKIITHAVDQVCSSAITVYLAGEERYATEYSQFMIHKPFHQTQEAHERLTEDRYQKDCKELKLLTIEYFQLIASRSNLTTQKIRYYVSKARDGEWWFSSKDAKALGIVTNIGFPIIPGQDDEEKFTEEH